MSCGHNGLASNLCMLRARESVLVSSRLATGIMLESPRHQSNKTDRQLVSLYDLTTIMECRICESCQRQYGKSTDPK